MTRSFFIGGLTGTDRRNTLRDLAVSCGPNGFGRTAGSDHIGGSEQVGGSEQAECSLQPEGSGQTAGSCQTVQYGQPGLPGADPAGHDGWFVRPLRAGLLRGGRQVFSGLCRRLTGGALADGLFGRGRARILAGLMAAALVCPLSLTGPLSGGLSAGSVGLSSELASALCPEARAADATGIVPTKVDVGVTAPSGVPVGTIIAWPVSRDPDEADKWLDCQGQTVLAADYPDLVAVLAGSSASSAALPDLRGLFLRRHGSQEHSQENGTSVGVTVTTHSSGDLLAVQGDAIRELSGNLPAGGQRVAGATLNDNFSGVFGVGGRGTAPGQGASSGSNLQAYFSAALSTPTDVEIRPVNMAVRYLMRALP